MLTIDGSYGEGGGQILRTCLSLAAILGRPVRIVNIRAGRKQPGLRPQHVQAVKAAAAVCDARLQGVHEHSRELLFEPRSVPRSGSYRFEIGTAGSATLVLQTVLIPLSLAGQPSEVTVRGGTHVAWSPPFHYLAEVYLPAIAPLGFRAEATLVRWGFYPRGGGEIVLKIWPHDTPGAVTPAWARPRGALRRLLVLSAAAQVGKQVAARQAKRAYNRLTAVGLQPEARLINPRSAGPGTCLFVLAEYEGGVRAGFTGFGRRGYPAERVADDAVDLFLRHQRTTAAVDRYLADQLVLPLAMAGQPLSYETSAITQHLLTNVWVVTRFLDCRFEVEGAQDEVGRVRLRRPASLPQRR